MDGAGDRASVAAVAPSRARDSSGLRTTFPRARFMASPVRAARGCELVQWDRGRDGFVAGGVQVQVLAVVVAGGEPARVGRVADHAVEVHDDVGGALGTDPFV